MSGIQTNVDIDSDFQNLMPQSNDESNVTDDQVNEIMNAFKTDGIDAAKEKLVELDLKMVTTGDEQEDSRKLIKWMREMEERRITEQAEENRISTNDSAEITYGSPSTPQF